MEIDFDVITDDVFGAMWVIFPPASWCWPSPAKAIESTSDTYPYMEVGAKDAVVGHEATVSKVADEQLFYLMSRGLSEEQAMGMIVNGFIEPVTRTLPMEYAVEWSRLIEINMEGSVG